MTTDLGPASKLDLDKIYDLINQAFAVEIGCEGVQYKNCEKFTLKDQVRKRLEGMLVIKQHRRVSVGSISSWPWR